MIHLVDQLQNPEFHHMCPTEFERDFFKAGLNPHDPIFAVPLAATDHKFGGRHNLFNKEWETFFKLYNGAIPPLEDILAKGQQLARDERFRGLDGKLLHEKLPPWSPFK